MGESSSYNHFFIWIEQNRIYQSILPVNLPFFPHENSRVFYKISKDVHIN